MSKFFVENHTSFELTDQSQQRCTVDQRLRVGQRVPVRCGRLALPCDLFRLAYLWHVEISPLKVATMSQTCMRGRMKNQSLDITVTSIHHAPILIASSDTVRTA